MKVYKRELPEGVKKQFAREKGVKVKLVNTLYLKDKKKKGSMWNFFLYNFLSADFIISSSEAPGFSFRTAETALLTLAFVNPSNTRAVVASSATPLALAANRVELSLPAPFTTLSLSSRISL